MRALLALCLMLATAAGCSRQAPVNNAADVEKAVQDYVHSRPGLSGTAISIEVRQVTFHDDRAEATVLFHSREDPQSSVALRYVLKRAATRTWVVEREKTRGISSVPPGGPGGTPQR